MTKRILVPLSRSERAEAVLPLVADVARARGATVRLLRVAPLPETRRDAYGRVIAYASQEMERLEAAALDDLWSVEGELEGIPVESRVRFGDPVEEILVEAEAFGAELIAVGAGSRRWPRRALGGPATRLVRRSPVPVMLLASPGGRPC